MMLTAISLIWPCRSARAAMRADQHRATSSFDCVGQISTPLALIRWMVLRSPPIDAGFGRDVVGHDPVAALAPKLGRGVLDHLLGLGREADDELRPLRLELADRRQDVGILDKRELRRAARRPSSVSARPPPPCASRRPRRRKCRHRPAAPPRRSAASARAVSTCTVFTPGGSGKFTGPVTSVTVAPAAAAARAIAWPCLPEERFAM